METVSIVTNVLLTIFAATALYVGYRQIAISNEIAARSAYESYHLLCLQYPELSCGDIEYEDLGKEQLDKYTVFVLYMLMTGERVYALFPHDAGWAFALEDDVRKHRRFISSPYFAEHRSKQEWLTQALIERVLAEDAKAGV
ncbi:MAG TPA: hypothetical protein VK614_12415 [Allosphingosinicella sp.]|nr:hypothetical protein [Allosphingosinicella sp.]